MDQQKKVTRVFQMTPETAMMFFMLVQWVTEHGVKDDVRVRQYILNWLAEKNHMDRVYDTKRSEDQLVSDWQRQGMKIIDGRNHVSSGNDRNNKRNGVSRLKRTLARLAKIFTLGGSK